MIMKDIKGYEGLYAATKQGQIWSYKSKKFLTPYDNGQGYLYVRLVKDGKSTSKRVNVLIAETFLGEPPADGRKYIVDHIKEDSTYDNSVDNLQWLTYSENLLKSNKRDYDRTHRPVRCVETGEVFKNQAEAGRAIGKHRYGINNVLKGKQKTCGGYHWEYVDE